MLGVTQTVSHVRKFEDRREAGRRLADDLLRLLDGDAVIWALPRGGLPVAMSVARALHLPVEVPIVRKIGHPSNDEFALGAIAEDGTAFIDSALRVDVNDETLASRRRLAEKEVFRRVDMYRRGEPLARLEGKTLIVIDDGIATGATMRVACDMGRSLGAARVIAAVPVAPVGWKRTLRTHADDMVAVLESEEFGSVAQFYRSFSQVSDEAVVAIRHELLDETVDMDACILLESGQGLPVEVVMRPGHRAFVVFVHGSGSGMASPRNRRVASDLNRRGYATALFDLLTAEESELRVNVFDIELLAERTSEVVRWLQDNVVMRGRPTCLFGASTGAAAALVCAARHPELVQAVVSRGGRPDLAGADLASVSCPVLLVVGGRDLEILALNREAASHLGQVHGPRVVPGASHLFEEPGSLDRVIDFVDEFLSELLG